MSTRRLTTVLARFASSARGQVHTFAPASTNNPAWGAGKAASLQVALASTGRRVASLESGVGCMTRAGRGVRPPPPIGCRYSTGPKTDMSGVARPPAPNVPPSSAQAPASKAGSSDDPAEATRIKEAWQLYFTIENTYLNYVRNGVTATAVGSTSCLSLLSPSLNPKP